MSSALIPTEAGYVVGVDIGGSNLRLALADADGTIVSRWTASTIGVRSAQTVVKSICLGVENLLQQASPRQGMLRAIAAGAPGVTNVDAGIVIATSYLMGWRDVPLQSLLESALGIPAAIDNDVNLAALGESWKGAARGAADFAFLAIGTGVGAGLVLGGSLFRGKAWMAGEIGYMLVPGTSETPAEMAAPGALESIIGGEGIRNQWQRIWNAAATKLPKNLLATEVFDHAHAGDALARNVLERTARTLAYAIYNMALVLNFPLFVLGGSVGMHPALLAATRKILEERNEHVLVELKSSSIGADAQLFGAIRVAINTAKQVAI